MSYQKWIGEGYLGGDAEMRYTAQTNKAVTAFSLAIDNGVGDKKTTLWFRVSVWEKLAEICAELKKGAHVLVEGRIEQSRHYTDKNGNIQVAMEVTGQTVRFLDRRSQDTSEAATAANVAAKVKQKVDESDVPF